MSSISTLEVYRSVLVDSDSTLVEQYTAMGRSILDSDGTSAVAHRPSNETRRTRKIGAMYREANELNYYHLSRSGVNVKHFGRKIISARERLDEGLTPKAREIDSIDQRLGHEPLADTLFYIHENEFGQDNDALIELVLDGVEDVESPMLYPGRNIFCFSAGLRANRFETGMLKRMSYISALAIDNEGGQLADVEDASIVDLVPFAFAETSATCELQRKQFIDNVRELLPVTVLLSPIDFNTIY